MSKPHLSFWQILNMNVGFFGIQFSFGLQQANMSPIYAYLGADESKLPLLWLAGGTTATPGGSASKLHACAAPAGAAGPASVKPPSNTESCPRPSLAAGDSSVR